MSLGDIGAPFSDMGKLVISALIGVGLIAGGALGAAAWLDARVATAAERAALLASATVAKATVEAAAVVAQAAVVAAAKPLEDVAKQHDERIRSLERSQIEIQADVRWIRRSMEHGRRGAE